MPFAPKIRKDILLALENFILPALSAQPVLQVLADPVRGITGVDLQVELCELLPHHESQPLQKVNAWPDKYMMSFSKPMFFFIYQGMKYERVGATEADFQRHRLQKKPHPLVGITKFPVAAPAVVFYPARVAHSNGVVPVPSFVDAQVLSVKMIDELIQVSHFYVGSKATTPNHNLAIQDPILVQLGRIYQQELREVDNAKVSQAILLAFMGRLAKYLQKHQPIISNSCWADSETSHLESQKAISQKNLQLFYDVTNYVQSHLSEPMSAEKIAGHCGVSCSHLNQVFRVVQGTSLMQYVTQLRIITAKNILKETNERVGDIARLVGFAGTSSFCTVFQKKVGLSPNQYRYQERLKRD